MMDFAFSRFPLAARVVSYLVIFACVFAALNLLGWFAFLTYKNQMRPTLSVTPDPAGLLVEKAAYYAAHAADYSALFLGDSRTLCGMHPDAIDPVWRRRSYNLAHWATWMPSQYALIADIAPVIPKDTVIVWSIGYQNFARSPIRAVYPPGWSRILPMALQGQDLSELVRAQLAFTPVTALVGRREEFFTHIIRLLDRPLWQGGALASPAAPSLPAEKLLADIAARPLTSFSEPWRDESGALASIAQYKTNGAMTRIELIPSYYRAQQAKDQAAGAGAVFDGFTPDPAQMALFHAILETLRGQGLRVIVNEMEEAPYRYASDAEKKKYRSWMRETIQPIVRDYGFAYVHADEARLTDADYFDFNHLNDRGIRKHNAVLARKLNRLAE